MSLDILNRWTGATLFSAVDATDIRMAVLAAIAADANLSDANLRGANLSEANLSGANLSRANLSRADLSEANLSGANLSGADLSGANLGGADLSGANLRGANLSDANLRDANLSDVRDDIFAVLSGAPAEAQAVADALRDGKVNGSAYSGECACLVGTIANKRGCAFDAVPDLTPNSSRPAEKWFLAIHTGDTPENSEVVRITYEWVTTWIARMKATFGGAA